MGIWGTSRDRSAHQRAPVPATVAAALVLLALAVVAPAPATAGPGQAGDVADWSTATGTDGRVSIADAQGRALTFRGFGTKTDAPATAISDDLLAAGQARGFNLLRLGIWWDALEPTQGTWNDAYLDEVVTVLDRAQAHGFHVIIDMHQDVFGPAFGDRGIPTWATRTDGATFDPQPVWFLNYLQPAVQNAFEHLYEDPDLRQAQIDAWLHVVDRVKGHQAILGYDLMNEPFGKIRPGEDLVAAAKRVEATQLTPMYQRLTDAISAVDADHWVFIEPPNLNALGIATSLGPVHGPKVAFYPHMYSQEVEGATYGGGDFTYDPAFFDNWAGAVAPYALRNQVPMLVGEWGVAKPDVPGMDAFIAQSVSTLDATTSGGWTMWAACLGTGYCPFDASGADRPGIDQVITPYARAVAGAVTSTVWDPDARVLRVRYRDSAATGPTTIYIPETKRYPDGFEVWTSDAGGPVTAAFDASTGVASVDVAQTGRDHAICVVPADYDGTCTATDPVPPPVAPPADDGEAPAAMPVSGAASYTG